MRKQNKGKVEEIKGRKVSCDYDGKAKYKQLIYIYVILSSLQFGRYQYLFYG